MREENQDKNGGKKEKEEAEINVIILHTLKIYFMFQNNNGFLLMQWSGNLVKLSEKSQGKKFSKCLKSPYLYLVC